MTEATQEKPTISPASLKLVQRPQVAKGKVVMDGDTPKMRAIKPEEVLSFRETVSEVVVVTTDGQKFRAAKSR